MKGDVEYGQLKEALEAIAAALDVRRNRFGKLEPMFGQAAEIQRLAVHYKVGGCADVAEQCMKVARAVLAEAAE